MDGSRDESTAAIGHLWLVLSSNGNRTLGVFEIHADRDLAEDRALAIRGVVARVDVVTDKRPPGHRRPPGGARRTDASGVTL